MKRRSFINRISQLSIAGFLSHSALGAIMKIHKVKFNIQTLTSGPKHHFFGYYGICPWNQDETHVLSLESSFQDHLPSIEETARIGLVDVNTGRFEAVTQTNAWNLQQGAMMHWHPKFPNSQIIYNDYHEGQAVFGSIRPANRQ
ncbi:hypothetical protein BH23BAC1_BH23BAC1_06300 [soil metagenome]